MKATILFFVLVVLLPFAAARGQEQYKVRKLVIDAGHGGKDPGALGRFVHEKELALTIALKTGAYIEKNLPDVEVVYTRKTDVFLELHERARIANEAQADVFISIHVNAYGNSSIYGTTTYVMGLNKSQDNLNVAKRENSVILYEEDYQEHYGGFDPNTPEDHIIFSLAMDTYQDQSIRFAEMVQAQFRERAARKDIGVRQANLVVLWQTTMPSILVETGFITNPAEEKYLNSDYGQDILASAIYRAFRDYKQKMEQKTDFVANEDEHPHYQVPGEKPNIIFWVQVMSSPRKIEPNSPVFQGLEIKRVAIEGRYKYLTARTLSPDEAKRNQTRIRKKFPGAFAVAYKDGQRISFSEAARLVAQ